jgi:hypothetical protein
MQIVSMTRFVIGIIFLILAAALLVRARGQRGFSPPRQAAALSLVAAGIFLAVGLGLVNV